MSRTYWKITYKNNSKVNIEEHTNYKEAFSRFAELAGREYVDEILLSKIEEEDVCGKK